MPDFAGEAVTFPVWVLAAGGGLFALFCALAFLRGSMRESVWALTRVGLAGMAALAAVIFLGRMTQQDEAAERRALAGRLFSLSALTMAPASPLACLSGAIADPLGSACERSVFGSADSVASAMSLTAARIALLREGAGLPTSDPALDAALAKARKAIEADHFGVAAHVLATNENCSRENCAAFALVQDSSRLAANMDKRVFEDTLARAMIAWTLPAAKPVAEAPSAPPANTTASAGNPTQFDFPSASSIPPVSIMGNEPGMPPEDKPAAAPRKPAAAAPARRNAAAPSAPLPIAPAAAPARP